LWMDHPMMCSETCLSFVLPDKNFVL
jgi:hypothetical protein